MESTNEAAFASAGGVDAAMSLRRRVYDALFVFVLTDRLVTQVITGATVSNTMSDEQVFVFPDVSVAVYTTEYLPSEVMELGFGTAERVHPGVLSE
jgi:hypothetical protein